MSDTEKLSNFLRQLADDVQKNQVLSSQLQHIGEFYMAYQFHEQAIKDNDETLNSNTDDITSAKFIKFLVMGWYIYQLFNNNTNIPDYDKTKECMCQEATD